jgi:hypothetical protein
MGTESNIDILISKGIDSFKVEVIVDTSFQKLNRAGFWWLTPIILATQAEIRSITT